MSAYKHTQRSHQNTHRLSDRMQQHSQLSKASRLRQLYSQLISLKLQGTTDDMDASILLLLFNLAEKPLQQGKLLEQPAAPPQHASGVCKHSLDHTHTHTHALTCTHTHTRMHRRESKGVE